MDYVLKDGDRLSLATLDFSDLLGIISSNPFYDISDKLNMPVIAGFDYTGPGIAGLIERDIGNESYPKDTGSISRMERQDDPGLPSSGYHKAIAAWKDNRLAGVLLTTWEKGNYGFWHYDMRFVDVRSDLRNSGLASAMLRYLDGADFLRDKILVVNNYDEREERNFDSAIKRELKADTYALVHPGTYGMATPEKPGMYG